MMNSRLVIARTALALAVALLTASAVQAATTTYEIDKAHSSIVFKIRHLLSKVPGKFNQFSGTVEVDPDKRDSVKAAVSIDVASIDTDEAKRDAHLKNEDFFDAAKFPTIAFTAGILSGVNGDRTKGKVAGTLTIKGVTKPVVLDVEWLGTATDPWGNQQAAFTATTKINRKDFGIVWNKTLDAGGYLIGDDVDIEISVEAKIPKPAK